MCQEKYILYAHREEQDLKKKKKKTVNVQTLLQLNLLQGMCDVQGRAYNVSQPALILVQGKSCRVHRHTQAQLHGFAHWAIITFLHHSLHFLHNKF